MKACEVITLKILKMLDAGVIPWRKPWTAGGGMPQSFMSRTLYRGVNVLLLIGQGYASPYWITFKQATEKGGQVKKGEKGTPVIFWNRMHRQVRNNQGQLEDRNIPFLKYYTVFNIAQVEGLDAGNQAGDYFRPIISCEEVIHKMQHAPTIEHGFARASYCWSKDTVKMPPRESFKSEASYYSTLFHELVHSTGHSSRLVRREDTSVEFGSIEYSKEKLVAEIGASFLCGYTGVMAETIENNASYINIWRTKLSEDPKLIISAAAQAQKAVDHILNRAAFDEKAA